MIGPTLKEKKRRLFFDLARSQDQKNGLLERKKRKGKPKKNIDFFLNELISWSCKLPKIGLFETNNKFHFLANPKMDLFFFQGVIFFLLLQTYKTKEWTSWKKRNKKFKQNHFCLVFPYDDALCVRNKKFQKSFVASFLQASFEFKRSQNSLILISSTLLQSHLPHSPLWFLDAYARRILGGPILSHIFRRCSMSIPVLNFLFFLFSSFLWCSWSNGRP